MRKAQLSVQERRRSTRLTLTGKRSSAVTIRPLPDAMLVALLLALLAIDRSSWQRCS